ncbi:membrane hypothetical protein [Desulfamplus magnetovallimortis]|uniref:Acyltransferase 3 domain-containing protein n=1 Tax=Desulfamplus magnetovallimortis TaxID=1246637 RepID=A0A1W1HBT6_9BACT|nr:acyltransferase family protein [Desulfamplus magnetovallimortis]SLM29954.1 membrane hypothetical protein [Desulfamplus magnetovallimortis]
MAAPLKTNYLKTTDPALSSKPVIEGIVFLRAIMSIFVVIWHVILWNIQSGTLPPSDIFIKERCSDPSYTFLDFISFQVLLTAVPVFILMSNYLFANNFINENSKDLNQDSDSFFHLKKRIRRHFLLFTFWFSVFTVYMGHFMGFSHVMKMPATVYNAIILIVSAGGSPYYFFLSLSITQIITYCARNLSIKWLIIMFAISTLIIAVLPFLAISYKLPSLTAYWNPLNFLPYSFVSLLITKFLPRPDKKRHFPITDIPITNNPFKHKTSGKTVKEYKILFEHITNSILLLTVICCLFSMMEWRYFTSDIIFIHQGYGIPAYARVSLIFSSTAIMLTAIFLPVKFDTLTGSIIRFMAKHSLGLYCIHFYLIMPANCLVAQHIKSFFFLLCATSFLTATAGYITLRILRIFIRNDLLR